MKLVAVTRIMNEDDIVEPFVRHHQGQIDHHLFLDNGSVDRTVEILRALQAEGLALTVLHNAAPLFMEAAYNTNLLQIAARNLGADWVLFLDADEFVDARRAPEGLRARIEALPPEVNCVAIPSVDYRDTVDDDAGDLLVPRRIRRREAAANESATKIFVRGTLSGVVEIPGGQHVALFNDKVIPSHAEDALVLAHYTRRSPYQTVWKNVVGRLKVLAAGRQETERGSGSHYVGPFEIIRDAPERLLRDPTWMVPGPATGLVDDPIRYDGDALRYTTPMDGPMKATRVLVGYAEQLARECGSMIDSNFGVRLQVERKATIWTKLF